MADSYEGSDMITEGLRPTKDQLAEAVTKAKQVDRLTSTAIKHTDHGAGMVRHYLPDHFHSVPLDEIRIQVQNLSRAGQEPGKRAKDRQQKAEQTLTRLRRLLQAAFPQADEHSAEYDELHASEAYKQYRDELKRKYGYRCQGCSLCFKGGDLQGHIVDYAKWQDPGMLLILCRDCHELIDSLRRRGASIVSSEPVLDLFAE